VGGVGGGGGEGGGGRGLVGVVCVGGFSGEAPRFASRGRRGGRTEDSPTSNKSPVEERCVYLL